MRDTAGSTRRRHAPRRRRATPRGDLAFFGLRLDTARAEAVAERLLAAGDKLSLGDFFPDGRVELPHRPLSLQPD